MSLSFRSTTNFIFRQFLRNFTPALYPVFVTPPTGERRKKVMDVYGKLGLHGCVGSMDATHVFWGLCPENLHNLCIGKEKKPTVAWNCVVDHSYCIHHVSDITYGATNDMTIARNDWYPQQFSNGSYKNVSYEILVERGVTALCRGPYLITDTGYLKQNCFICPMSHRVDRPAVLFSEFMESTRKDVECTFGQLKNRWRILKRALEMKNLHEIDMLFKACCILHNMILIYDHRDIEHWEEGVDWELLHPDDVEPELINEANYMQEIEDVEAINHPRLPKFLQRSGRLMQFNPKSDHQKLVNLLCKSFKLQYEMGLISWPRSFSSHQKRIMPCHRIVDIANRVERDIYDTLVVAPSQLLGLDEFGEYTIDLNNGLFAGINYKSGNRVVDFKEGERISITELHNREQLNQGGYALHINMTEAMDNYSIKDTCKASMANDPTNAWNLKTKAEAVPNCVLCSRISSLKVWFYLQAVTDIKIGDEIIFEYSNSYIFNVTSNL